MSAQNQSKKPMSLLGVSLLGGLSWYCLGYTGPILRGHEINIISAGFGATLAISVTIVISGIFKSAANTSEFIAANTPTGNKGKAKWATSVRDLGKNAVYVGFGLFCGAFKKERFLLPPKHEVVYAKVESNALIAAPAGTGKNIAGVTPTILSLNDSMAVNDLKTELAPTLKRELEERGFHVHVLNYGGRFQDRLGKTDSHNGLNLISDCFVEAGRILDISNIVTSMCLQLLPEPTQGGNSDNTYFRNGGRYMLEFAILFVVITNGEQGNLADVNNLVSDRDLMLEEAQWVAGKEPRTDGTFSQLPFRTLGWYALHDERKSEAFIEYFTNLAAKVASVLANADSKAGESFLSEAQQAVSIYHRGTSVYEVFSHSTVRFRKMKDGEENSVVFYCLSSADLENQTRYAAFDQFCMLYELKRHPNLSRKVYFICDEATNFYLKDFASKTSVLTWGRSCGIVCFIYLQSIAAWTAQYGKEAKEILLSETQVKLFLPGQRDPETLALIKRLLGKYSTMMKGRRGSRTVSEANIEGIDYREEAIDMMSEEEIRQTDKTLAFIHDSDAAQLELIKHPEVDVWQDSVDENPYHKGKFRLPIRLRIKWDRRPLMMRIKQFLTFWRRSP